jgi:hypothetical protein
MTETMRERVARAIRRATPGDVFLTEDNVMNMAGSAIFAMREPTPTMMADGFVYTGGPRSSTAQSACWQAMIDAALAEPQTTV